MVLDRKKAPDFKVIDRIDVLKAQHNKLDNGIDLYSVSAGSQEISKLEFVFRAGMYYQPATLIASTTNNQLESGTRSYTADQISDGIDFYGSFLEFQVEQDYATITLYSLNKFMKDGLRFIEELLKYPVFPENEFRIYINNKKQKHSINSQKVNVLVKRRFTEMLFGKDHPYGRDVHEEDFSRISLSEVKTFFASHYGFGNCTIIASGLLPADLRDTLNHFFGKDKWGMDKAPVVSQVASVSPADKSAFIEKADAVQSAIRLGRLLFNRTHPDYFKFQVLNTVFGGYFGSRLMANIREDKGYTYGIGSGITNLVHGGYFFISTEVGSGVTQQTLEEVYREMERLRNDLIPTEELETVRNYIIGNFLRSVDGPFALGEKFRSIWEFGLDYSYFDNYFEAVKKVTPAELRDLANQYLKKEDMIECVAGSRG